MNSSVHKYSAASSLLIIILLTASLVRSQCPTGPVELFSQSQVDSFPILYPQCDSINNLLQIGYVRYATNLKSDITDLSPLGGIKYARTLQIWNNEFLQTLSGLNIQSARGITIVFNDALLDVEGLNNITELGDSFSAQNNPLLASITGINNLSTVEYFFVVGGNHSLVNIDLPKLTSVGSKMSITSNNDLSSVAFTGLSSLNSLLISNNDLINNQVHIPLIDTINELQIRNNDGLTDLSIFQHIDHVSGEWDITNNPNLVNYNIPSLCQSISNNPEEVFIEDNGPGYETLNEIQMHCGISNDCPQGYYFYDQPSIDNFKSMYPNCQKVQGNIHILGDRQFDIIRFDSLHNLTSISGTLHIEDNHGLLTLEGLHNIDSIGVDLKIDGNFEIQDYLGLRNLHYIGRNLLSNFSTEIVDFKGLENIQEIRGNLEVTNNDELINFIGLDNLITIDGQFLLQWNDSQINFEGLSQLKVIGDNFNILNSFKLVNFEGLSQLESIGRTFWPGDGPSLEDFTGLSNLKKIGLTFFLTNDNVKNFTGLESLDSIGFEMHINGCDSLETLTGLTKLKHLDNLTIFNTKELSNLEGLNCLEKIDSSITISGNTKLQNCSALAICNTLSLPHTNIDIQSNNDVGCNSESEVLSNCDFCSCSYVATNEWTGNANDHDWNTALNWSLGRVPELCDKVNLLLPNSVNIFNDANCYDLTSSALVNLYLAPNANIKIACEEQ